MRFVTRLPLTALERRRRPNEFQECPESRQAFNGMSEFLIPDDIKKFTLEGIDSIAQLEG
jgi:hypothetical protein